MPIFLKANHQLESRMPAIGQSGSEGGAKSAFVPTPINSPGLQAWVRKERKFALQGQPNVFLSSPPEIILSGYVRVAPFQVAFPRVLIPRPEGLGYCL